MTDELNKALDELGAKIDAMPDVAALAQARAELIQEQLRCGDTRGTLVLERADAVANLRALDQSVTHYREQAGALKAQLAAAQAEVGEAEGSMKRSSVYACPPSGVGSLAAGPGADRIAFTAPHPLPQQDWRFPGWL